LYQALIAPFASQLNAQIVIIPDGILSSLPFEVLLSEPSETKQGIATLPYFLKQKSLSYHYAAALLFEEKKASNPSNDWAIFAPSFADEPEFQDKAFLAFLEKNGTKNQIFKENQATKGNFLAKMSDCQILHINTHGIANDSVGDLSYLRLSDDKFYSAELYATKIKADLVTLSACQTANGEFRHGEGTIGLTLGFLYAGAKSVVSSLWNVNQQSTGAFMQQFYQRLLQKEAKNSDALRAAKLAIIAENPAFAHPKYWAAFVLIGNPEIALERGGISYWWWMLLGVLSVGILAYYRKIKEKVRA
jgi:CHAT domain-containing protein